MGWNRSYMPGTRVPPRLTPDVAAARLIHGPRMAQTCSNLLDLDALEAPESLRQRLAAEPGSPDLQPSKGQSAGSSLRRLPLALSRTAAGSVPSPSCPASFDPKANASPSVVQQRVWSDPQATCRGGPPGLDGDRKKKDGRVRESKRLTADTPAPWSVRTTRGSKEEDPAEVPRPSCPSLLSPNAHTFPDSPRQMLWLYPADTAFTGSGIKTCGRDRRLGSPASPGNPPNRCRPTHLHRVHCVPDLGLLAQLAILIRARGVDGPVFREEQRVRAP